MRCRGLLCQVLCPDVERQATARSPLLSVDMSGSELSSLAVCTRNSEDLRPFQVTFSYFQIGFGCGIKAGTSMNAMGLSLALEGPGPKFTRHTRGR